LLAGELEALLIMSDGVMKAEAKAAHQLKRPSNTAKKVKQRCKERDSKTYHMPLVNPFTNYAAPRACATMIGTTIAVTIPALTAMPPMRATLFDLLVQWPR
jgi:hypothetical protein